MNVGPSSLGVGFSETTPQEAKERKTGQGGSMRVKKGNTYLRLSTITLCRPASLSVCQSVGLGVSPRSSVLRQPPYSGTEPRSILGA